MTTKVSVVMTVYNGEQFLRPAVDSILQQTWPDFELIVVDDGSTDSTGQILDKYAQSDRRVRVLHQTRAGISASSNCGCALAEGDYIARLDHDDLSLPERLARQVDFMDAHPSVGACGTWTRIIGGTKDTVWRYPCEDSEIRCRLLFGSVLVHSSSMLRKAVLAQIGGYRPDFVMAQDYDLWSRMAMVAELANLPEALTVYRVHPAGISRKAGQMLAEADRIRLEQLTRLGLQPTEAEMLAHQALSTEQFPSGREFVQAAEAWLCRLREANRTVGIYQAPVFARVLAQRWLLVCQRSAGLGPWTFIQFIRSPLAQPLGLSKWETWRLGWECVISLQHPAA
jgi:hypothetical protein